MAKAYSKKLSDPRWQRKRLKILERDKWTCKKCNDKNTELHVHHLEYNKEPWNTPNKFLVTLCAHCHEFIERLKTRKVPVHYSEVKVYKSDNWIDGDRIMYGRYDDILIMEIYDKNSEFIIGFNIPEHEFIDIKKIMYKTPSF